VEGARRVARNIQSALEAPMSLDRATWSIAA
jgi:hypothetical protein